LWAKSAAFNVIIWQFFKLNSRVSFYFLWHSYCLLNLSCVPNWLWGGAVCRAMLTTRHCSRHIWARSWPNFYLACLFLFSLPTCHLENWNFNRQFWRWVSKHTNDMTRLPPYARTQMCHPACVSQCVCVDLNSLLGTSPFVWVEMYNMPSYSRTFLITSLHVIWNLVCNLYAMWHNANHHFLV
jgi:hypothetical protein